MTAARIALALALVVVMALSAHVAAAQTCPSVDTGTLAFTCDDACARGQPCMAPSPTNLTAGCRCFTINKRIPSDYVAFQFLVPFDTTTTAALKQVSPASFEKISGYNDTTSVAWASNSELTKVAPMSLSTVTTSVTLRGGSSLTEVVKGFAAAVDIDAQFLAGQAQVTALTLANIKLGTSANTLAANLPARLETLDWKNTALTAFPTALRTFQSLQFLDLGYNNIEDVTADHVVPALTNLTLNANKLARFTAVFPKLTSLNLAFNKLTSVPTVVSKHSGLTLLNLGGNVISVFDQSHAVPTIKALSLFSTQLTKFDAYMPALEYLDLTNTSLTDFPTAIYRHRQLSTLHLKDNARLRNVTFTNVQANFINTLDKFTIASASLKTDCELTQRYKFTSFYLTVCISETIDLNVIMGARVNITTPSPWNPSSSIDGSEATNNASSSNSKLVPALAIGGAVVLLVLLIAAFIVRRKRSASAKATSDDYGTGETGGGSGPTNPSGRGGDRAVSLWNDQELLSLSVRVDDIKDVRKIGSGAFADVWLVQFRASELLASKRLRASDAERQHIDAFVHEIKLVARLTHPSIVAFKGVAWVRENDLQALFEYMPNGDLRTYLASAAAPTPWTAEKLEIAIDIAEALVYVHSFNPPLVHRDLKSRNVLLDATMHAKVTDFGVSRYQSEQSTMTAGVGTCRWLAPEVIAGNGRYGPPADVFSFGAVLAELDTHAIPYDDARSASGEKLIDVALLQMVARGALTPSVSASCPAAIAELAQRCFALDPAARPRATEVAYTLRTLKRSLTGNFM